MREVVELPDAQLAALDAWRVARGMTRAEAIEQAVKGLVEPFTPENRLEAECPQLDEEDQRDHIDPHFQAQIDEIMTWLSAISRSGAATDAAALAQLKQMISRVVAEGAFGLWKSRTLDGLAEQERLRGEWDDR